MPALSTTPRGADGALHAAEEIEQGVIHVSRAFLLGPMAAVGYIDDGVQVGHDRPGGIVESVEGADDVTFAADVERWRGYLRVLPGGGQLPVAIEIAVPVDAAGEAAGGELVHEGGEL